MDGLRSCSLMKLSRGIQQNIEGGWFGDLFMNLETSMS